MFIDSMELVHAYKHAKSVDEAETKQRNDNTLSDHENGDSHPIAPQDGAGVPVGYVIGPGSPEPDKEAEIDRDCERPRLYEQDLNKRNDEAGQAP